MSKSTRSFKSDARVGWREGFKPMTHPYAVGRVFTSQGKVTFVVWDGSNGKPVAVATAALVGIR